MSLFRIACRKDVPCEVLIFFIYDSFIMFILDTTNILPFLKKSVQQIWCGDVVYRYLQSESMVTGRTILKRYVYQTFPFFLTDIN